MNDFVHQSFLHSFTRKLSVFLCPTHYPLVLPTAESLGLFFPWIYGRALL